MNVQVSECWYSCEVQVYSCWYSYEYTGLWMLVFMWSTGLWMLVLIWICKSWYPYEYTGLWLMVLLLVYLCHYQGLRMSTYTLQASSVQYLNNKGQCLLQNKVWMCSPTFQTMYVGKAPLSNCGTIFTRLSFLYSTYLFILLVCKNEILLDTKAVIMCLKLHTAFYSHPVFFGIKLN